MKQWLKPLAFTMQWIDARFPMSELWKKHAAHYYVPKNLNFWYLFGVFSLVVLVNQLITGVWLTMYYTPTATEAFDSVQHIMRDVHYGWLLRYMHSTGASAFFVVVYLHMYRGLIYGSYQKPRELVWLLGMLIYALLMAEAFTGYVLPWGQMSFWAGKVAAALYRSIPLVGPKLALWILGDYHFSGVTLHRFFSYHVAIIPMMMVGLVVFHIMGLHQVGSNNPKGIEIRESLDKKGNPKDGIPFHPYYTAKDFFGVVVFLMVFASVIFFFPMAGGHFLEPENFIPANPLVTPAHIAPVWYLAPFFAILRAVPGKVAGIFTMAASVAFLFVLPWLDRSPVKALRYKGKYSMAALIVWVISFMGLGYLGTLPPTTFNTYCARCFTLGYFLFFILMPFYTRKEATQPVPDRI